ncbi:MAG: TIGR02757 family protein [Thermodesulfobacteriota bacterium]
MAVIQDRALLKRGLDRLYSSYEKGFLSSDPLCYVHRVTTPVDREIVGLIASSLAYGRVAGIKNSIEKVLAVMEGSPGGFTMNFRPHVEGRLFDGFRHRFNTGEDVSCLLYFARQMIEQSGSIGGFFMRGYRPGDRNIKNALSTFTADALSLDSAALYGAGGLPARCGVRYFFPSPAKGSPCKRLNLYLRWMVRRGDGLDFGIWKGVSPSKLVIPLDTHIARIAGNLGLTRRKSRDWKMAEEITESLKRLDPEDPVKYDFALCRLGILDKCPNMVDSLKCSRCLLRDICVL